MGGAHHSIMTDTPPGDDQLVAALPTTYAVIVRMDRSRRTDDEIATVLGVDVEAVEGLRTVATRKLAELRSRRHDPVDPRPAPS